MSAEKAVLFWGCNPDGTKFVQGVTARQLITALRECIEQPDGDGRCGSWDDEVCVVIQPYQGLPGKVLSVERGTPGQLWLVGFVVDESIAEGRRPPS